jgi:hypothetical protein
MQQQVNQPPTDAAAVKFKRAQSAEDEPRRPAATAALWRAVAGMALSVALACVIVMLEFTGQAVHRADRISRHAAALLSKVSRLGAEVAAERARVATARRELAAAEVLRTLLREPDADMLKLSPPPPAAGGRKIVSARRSEAALVVSPRDLRAALLVTGLKPAANDTPFVLWWITSRGAPVRAGEFRTAADGSALVTAALPPGIEVTAAMVTVESAAESDAVKGAEASAPSGPVALRGTIVR